MARSFRADPGGTFESDEHRRVLGHLHTPDDDAGRTFEDLHHRLRLSAQETPEDDHAPETLQGILDDLKAEGYATDRGGWRMTKKGFEAITDAGVEGND